MCVVGSGAGGAIVARALARAAGRSWWSKKDPTWTSRDFTQREETMAPLLYSPVGLRAGTDATVMILHGAVVGGSSVVSDCVCERLPPSSWTNGASASV